jgi:hypothetical protein
LLAPLLAAALTLTINKSHALARFDPRLTIGQTIDAEEHSATEEVFTRRNIAAILSAGFHPLSYRLATELGGEAWHWNPRGTWSDAAHQQGYWISASESDAPIDVSYGYRLPRRGNTIDQSRNDGYSRIDDGDASTFWKSNPYLSSPQWLFADLGVSKFVDAITIDWAKPYAADYVVEYWTGDDAVNNPPGGRWKRLATVRDGNGGRITTHFDRTSARYVRVLMTRACCAQPGDWRDSAGYAVREVRISDGAIDLVRHGKSKTAQTIIWVSSIDPWHRATDIDRDMEQPGFDRVFASGLTRGLPMLTPVALLYGTPEDAAAEIRFLRKRAYNVTQIELGEEPDGQLFSPEAYADLYMRFAEAIHRVDPNLKLGGPAFQSTRDYTAFWPDARGRTEWMGRFVDALRSRGRLADFAFFSFEWYPFDDVCDDVQTQLAETKVLLDEVLAQWRSEGVPTTIPWLATEYGWSSYAAQAEIDIPGALFNTEFVADFLTAGGAGAYFYGVEPDTIFAEPLPCHQYGNHLLFLGDQNHRILSKLATYHAATLLTRTWLARDGVHELYPVAGTTPLLRAWAVKRPNGTFALLVINKDAKRTFTIRVDGWSQVEVTQFSPREYAWAANGESGRPLRSTPPRKFMAEGRVEVPGYSISVIEAPPPDAAAFARSRDMHR